ncbi:transposase [Neobacillus sp. PS3-12]|uniref:transposase n=1 Tax=Neobacillus sp. PS3-12 TaxID=3070677 RepID=UPI0035A86FF0
MSASMLFKKFPNLKKFYSRCGVLWRKGYFVSTVGRVSEATVKRYIQEQKTKT